MEIKEKKIYIPVNYLEFKDKKTLSILINLFYWKNNDNLVNITLDKIIKDCGYIPQSGEGRTTDKFKLALSYLQEQNIIECDIIFKNITLKQLVTIKLENYDKNKKHIVIFYSDYKKIIEDKVKSTMKDNMILLYLMIKKGIGAKNYKNEEIKYKSLTNNTLMKRCEVSKDTLNGCLKELGGLGLICYDNIGYIIKNDKCRKASNVYALTYDNLELGLKASKKYYEDRGYTFETNKNKLKRFEKTIKDWSEDDMELSIHDLQMIEIMNLLDY